MGSGGSKCDSLMCTHTPTSFQWFISVYGWVMSLPSSLHLVLSCSQSYDLVWVVMCLRPSVVFVVILGLLFMDRCFSTQSIGIAARRSMLSRCGCVELANPGMRVGVPYL